MASSTTMLCQRVGDKFYCPSPLHHLPHWALPRFVEARFRTVEVWGLLQTQQEIRCGGCKKVLLRENIVCEERAPQEELPPPPPQKKRRQSPPPPAPFPVSEWTHCINAQPVLTFMMESRVPARLIKQREAARERFWQRVAVRAARRKPAEAVFAGVVCPRIGGGWHAYRRQPSESMADWAKRLRKMVAELKNARRAGALIRSEELASQNPLSDLLWCEPVRKDKNPYSCLDVDAQEDLRAGVWKQTPKVKSLSKIKFMCGPKQFRAYEYIEGRLALKSRLALLRDEWREARALRREKMRRVILIDRSTHVVHTLRGQMENMLETYCRQHKEEILNSPAFDCPKGEMDTGGDAHGDTNGTETIKKSNVVLENQRGVSKTESLPKTKPRSEFSCIAAPLSKISEKTLSDRWVTIAKGKWSKTDEFNKILFTMDLLRDVLKSPDFRASPNYKPFSVHSYWRGNMRIRVLLNSNVRQYGQLQVRFYYGAKADANLSARTNVWVGSQQPHALITLNTSNNADLVIPFEYVYPIMCVTRGGQTWDSPPPVDDFANLGKLFATVLVPLTSAATTSAFVEYTVKLAFEESEFAGMVDQRLIEYNISGQMMSMAALYAINEVANSLDGNRDRPNFTHTGTPMIPVNQGSWCYGNGQADFTNILRLNPRGVLPYPEGRVPNVDEMKIDFVKGVFGLFRRLIWNAQVSTGSLLHWFDAAPMLSLSEYPTVQVDNTQCYVLPPVAVLSNLYAWWRGSLNLRIDIVGATELSGRLLVCYVPKYYKTITISEAWNCAHTIFDLSENRQFNFEIPYVADKMFWGRRRVLQDEYATQASPGSVYIFVETALIANSTIPSDCHLLLYIAGGDSFELSVPAFPYIGLCFNPNVSTKDLTNTIYPRKGYYPTYVGTWHSFYSNYPYVSSLPILRYGEVSDHVTQFEVDGQLSKLMCRLFKLPKDKYQVSWKATWSFGIDMEEVDTDNSFDYIIPFMSLAGYIYAIPIITNDENAKTLVKDLVAKLDVSSHIDLIVVGVEYVKYWAKVAGKDISQYFVLLKINEQRFWRFGKQPPNIQQKTGNFLATLETITANNDERKTIETPPSRPQASACGKNYAGMKVWGERFTDLKDYCRRYQLYTYGRITNSDQDKRVIVLKVPIVPQGLDLSVRDAYWNRVRDGPIPLICSGYRFFCGSIRFRIVTNLNSLVKEDISGKIFVQHRPDVEVGAFAPSVRTAGAIGTDDVELPGYASYYQFDNTNNVISVEVPFYLPVVRTYLQRPTENDDAHRWSHLGELAIGFTMQSQGKLDYEIYYAFGDDARSSVFVGFPPMIDASQISPSSGIASNAIVTEVGPDIDWPSDEEIKGVKGEVFSFNFNPFSKISKTADNVNEKLDQIDVQKINELATEGASTLSGIKEFISNNVPTIEGIQHKWEKYTATIISVISNFIHCLINLNIATIATAIVSIFATIKLVSVNFVSKITEQLFSLFKQIPSDGSIELKEDPVATTAHGEAPGDDYRSVEELVKGENDATCAYIATIIAAIGAALAIGPRLKRGQFHEACSLIYNQMHKFTMTANSMFTFIKNNLIVFQRIGNWLVNSTPKIKDIEFLKNSQKFIHDWAIEVVELTDPWKEKELFTNIKKAGRVHSCCMKGNLMMIHLSSIQSITPAQLNVISRLINKITELRDRLMKVHMSPPVRFEPFVVELTGGTGVGKTFMFSDLPMRLLKDSGIRVNGEVIYNRNLGTQYWNNMRNQPICVIDEKFPIEGPGFSDIQIAELFQLKSRTVFNPPMADLPDKNIRYNPLQVWYGSNCAFPNITGVLDVNALNRRRDALWKVEIKPEYIEKYKGKLPNTAFTVAQIPKSLQDSGKYEYLQFSRYLDPKDANSLTPTPVDFDAFYKDLREQWFQYYARECEIFERALNHAYSLTPDADHIDSFDSLWLSKVGIENNAMLNFKNDYHEIVTSFRNGIIDERVRRELMFSAIQDLNTKKERHESLVEEFRRKTAEANKAVTLDEDIRSAKPNAPMPAEDAIKELNKTRPLCFHKVLVKDGLQGEYAAKWKKIYGNFWKMPEIPGANFKVNLPDEYYDVASNLTEVLKSKKKIVVMHKSGHKVRWFVSDEPCDHEDCAFSGSLRMAFYNKYIQVRENFKTLLLNSRYDVLEESIPPAFFEKNQKTLQDMEKNRAKQQKEKERFSFLRNWYETLKEGLFSINWKKWFQRLAMVLGAFFFVGGLWKVWTLSREGDVKAYAAGMDVAYKAQGFASGDRVQGTSKKETPKKLAEKVLSNHIVKGNMGNDLQFKTSIESRIRGNTFFMEIFAGNDASMHFQIGRCVGICGSYALLPDHYMETFQNFQRMYPSADVLIIPTNLKLHNMALKFKLNEFNYQRWSNSSLGLIKMPLRMPAFKDIRSFIAPKDLHPKMNTLGRCVEVTYNEKKEEVCTTIHNVTYISQPPIRVGGDTYFSDFDTSDCYAYRDFHGAGRCGTLLVNNYSNSPIVAMHVAGGSHWGFAEVIYREMFDDLVNNKPAAGHIQGEGIQSNWCVDGEVVGLGAVGAKFAHRANQNSRIIPSFLKINDELNEFVQREEVAVLSPKDFRLTEENKFSPMVEGCKHHGKPLLPFNDTHLQQAVDDYLDIVLAKCKPQRQQIGVLTAEEAAGGFEGLPGYEHIEWKSSEGFPFTAWRPKGQHDKRWLFEFDEKNRMTAIKPLLKEILEQKWEMRKQNIIPRTVFTDCLKDCTIPKEKVLEPGKTRIFSISPVDFTIQQRQCTLDFSVAFMACRRDLEHMIGINPDSMEWTLLAQDLLSMGPNIMTGDYSKFGDTIPPEFIHAAFYIIAEWYKHNGILTEDHSAQLKIMAHEVSNSVHLMFDFLYQVICGQPSGNSLTVIINTIANSLYLRICWLSVMANTAYSSLVDFHSHVKLFSYGDDIIVALSEIIKELFNCLHLQKFFASHYLKFTNANKGEEIIKYTSLNEATFLKRGFLAHPTRLCPQIMLAPLEVASIEETPLWVSKDSFGNSDPGCLNFIDISKQVSEDALRNAFGRGPIYYEEFGIKLKQFWRKHNETLKIYTWQELDKKIFDEGFILCPYMKYYLTPK